MSVILVSGTSDMKATMSPLATIELRQPNDFCFNRTKRYTKPIHLIANLPPSNRVYRVQSID